MHEEGHETKEVLTTGLAERGGNQQESLPRFFFRLRHIVLLADVQADLPLFGRADRKNPGETRHVHGRFMQEGPRGKRWVRKHLHQSLRGS